MIELGKLLPAAPPLRLGGSDESNKNDDDVIITSRPLATIKTAPKQTHSNYIDVDSGSDDANIGASFSVAASHGDSITPARPNSARAKAHNGSPEPSPASTPTPKAPQAPSSTCLLPTRDSKLAPSPVACDPLRGHTSTGSVRIPW